MPKPIVKKILDLCFGAAGFSLGVRQVFRRTEMVGVGTELASSSAASLRFETHASSSLLLALIWLRYP